MRADQVIVAAYLVLGIVIGMVSNYFNKVLGSLLLAFIIPIVVYLISAFPLFKLVKQKKKNWLVKNSLITFLLVWIIIWIVAHNM